jgi:hypothetical protein
MRKSGSSTFAIALALIAGVAVAAQIVVEDIPQADVYVVSATVAPEQGGAEVCGGDKDQGHIDFRIGFDGGTLCVNGVDAGAFDPGAIYSVTVSCSRAGPQWLATTRVFNLNAGQMVYEQANYRMPSPAEQAWAQAAAVIEFSVQ